MGGGGADQIVFYSGEIGRRYDNHERTIAEGTPKLVFQSAMSEGVLANPDTLRLLVSTNLKGYDSLSVQNATWTDITNRNKKWPTTLSTTLVTSDSISLADFNGADKVNIAFRANGKRMATAAQRKWQISNLALHNVLADGTNTALFSAAPTNTTSISTASTFLYTGWVQVSFKNFARTWNVGSAGQSSASNLKNNNGVTITAAYPLVFDPSTAVDTEENDDWVITTAVNLKQTKPDVGTVVKTITNINLKNYTYVFKTAGTYVVSFVATNVNSKQSASIMRQVTVTVTP